MRLCMLNSGNPASGLDQGGHWTKTTNISWRLDTKIVTINGGYKIVCGRTQTFDDRISRFWTILPSFETRETARPNEAQITKNEVQRWRKWSSETCADPHHFPTPIQVFALRTGDWKLLLLFFCVGIVLSDLRRMNTCVILFMDEEIWGIFFTIQSDSGFEYCSRNKKYSTSACSGRLDQTIGCGTVAP